MMAGVEPVRCECGVNMLVFVPERASLIRPIALIIGISIS